MTKEEKIRRLREWIEDVGVWLEPIEENTLTLVMGFDDKPVLGFTKQVFRMSYGLTDAKTGKRIPLLTTMPFTGVAVASFLGESRFVVSGATVCLSRNDSQNYWHGSEAQTDRFWHKLFERTERLRDHAKTTIWRKLKALRFGEAYRAARVWWGARRWLTSGALADVPKHYRPGEGYTHQWPLVRAFTETEAREKIEAKFSENSRIAYAERHNYRYWVEDGRPVSIFCDH